MFIIHVGLVVIMAIDAGELGKTGRIGVAIDAIAPGAIMLSRIDWKRF